MDTVVHELSKFTKNKKKQLEFIHWFNQWHLMNIHFVPDTMVGTG